MRIVIFLALLLTGCMATNPQAWNTTATDAKFKGDSYECQRTVSQDQMRAAEFGGAIVPLAAMFLAPGAYRECMEARGWTRGESSSSSR